MLTDHDLISRISGGDAVALEELLRRYRDPLCRHIRRIARDDDVAADLTQETSLRVWTYAEQWDGTGEVRSWLYRIATNVALNYLRSQRRRPNVEPAPRDADGYLADASETPEEYCLRREGLAVLHRLVEHLPHDQRETLSLVYDSGMDIGAAAEALGVPAGTVKSRLHYARRRLLREWAQVMEWEEIE